MDGDWDFGQAAEARGFVAARDVLECLNIQVRAEAALGKHFTIGEILFLRGHLDEDQHAAIARDEAVPGEASRRGKLFGEVLLERGYTTPEAILRALAKQRSDDQAGRPHRPLGAILLEQQAIEPHALEATLRMFTASPHEDTAPLEPEREAP